MLQTAVNFQYSKFCLFYTFLQIAMNSQTNAVKYLCCKDPFMDITFFLHIKRQPLFYGFNFILPCFLVNALAVLVFLLPADSGERITLSLFNILLLLSKFQDVCFSDYSFYDFSIKIVI